MSIETVWQVVQARVCLVGDGPAGPCARWPCDLPRRVVTEGITPWRLRTSGRIICPDKRPGQYRAAITDAERRMVAWSEPKPVRDWLAQIAARKAADEARAGYVTPPWPEAPLPLRLAELDEIPTAATRRIAKARGLGWEILTGYGRLYVAGAKRVPEEAASADIGGLADGARKRKARGKHAPPAETVPVLAEHVVVVGRRGEQAWQAVWERREGQPGYTFTGGRTAWRRDRYVTRLDAAGLTKVIDGQGT
jgi:hypothetical protein